VKLDRNGLKDWDVWCVDGASVRASRAAGGASQKSFAHRPDEPSDHALGRSRGGFGSKLHLVTDGTAVPLTFEVAGGQVNESTRLESMVGRYE
jgi:hypothetical protein